MSGLYAQSILDSINLCGFSSFFQVKKNLTVLLYPL